MRMNLNIQILYYFETLFPKHRELEEPEHTTKKKERSVFSTLLKCYFLFCSKRALFEGEVKCHPNCYSFWVRQSNELFTLFYTFIFNVALFSTTNTRRIETKNDEKDDDDDDDGEEERNWQNW